MQRIRLLGSQPHVLQNCSITVPYDEVFNVQATAQSVLVLSGVQIDQHHFNFTLTIKKRDTGDDAGVLQLDDTVMADVAVWNATVPTQILLVTPGADSALSVDPLSGAVLAEWTGNVPRLDLQGAAFVHVNASFGTAAAPHTSACVVLVHYSRRVISHTGSCWWWAATTSSLPTSLWTAAQTSWVRCVRVPTAPLCLLSHM